MLTGAAEGGNKDYLLYTPVYELCDLHGATFDIITAEDIYDAYGRLLTPKGAVVDTVTTGQDGKATSRLLHLGRYILVETAAPYGTVLDPTPRPVTLGMDGEISDIITKPVTVHNERQRAEIALTKACEIPEGAEDDFNPYGGIIFGLYAREDIKTVTGETAIPAEGLLEFITFDATGKADIKTDLPFGAFYVQEFLTHYGYALDDTQYDLTFDYEAENTATVIIPVNGGQPIDNRLMRGSLKVIKTFEGKDTPIQGVPFVITGETLVGVTVRIETETDENGEILLENLLVGKYTVQELDSDLTVGYILSPEQNAVVAADEIAEMTIENKLQRGDLRIIKTFEGKDTPIAGVKFTVSGVSIAGIEFYGEFETDSNGEIFIEDLPIGDYKVFEIGSDLTAAYILSDEQTAAVAADELAEMRIDNKLIRGDIRIIKTDKDTGALLAGAKFGLYQNGELIAEDTTGTDGIAAFLNVPYGDYEIKELSAPEGYKLTDKTFTAKIRENGEIITIDADNEKIPDEPKNPGNPKTGDTSNTTLWLVLMGASVAGLIVTTRRRKRTSGTR
jgi:LPXTG-motif cell wall-anchored protein